MLPADLSYVQSDGRVPASPTDRPRPEGPGVRESGIHVDLVEVGPAPNGRRVRAVVRLGGLSPADVRVELLRTEAAGDPPAARPPARRMWSS